ncbi:MAG TPA: hypothetical protein VKZ53_22910 [Candidatus Angelobacter sp.]|nr:hypothetical protein [Candidatus Angelobacter sp.]
MLDPYTQHDPDETRAAQGAFLVAVGFKPEVILKAMGWIVGWTLRAIIR